MIHGDVNQKQIDRSLEFWRTRTARQLTSEDARQINLNMTQFFEILAEWDERERKPPQSETGKLDLKKRA